jgi:Ca2+-binding EF-hand superfamily protein
VSANLDPLDSRASDNDSEKTTAMRKSYIFAACLCLLGGACSNAWAAETAGGKAKKDGPKAKFFEKYDKNKNGIIDADEKEAIRKDYAEKPDGDLKRFDANKDGKLDDEEILAVKPPTGAGKNAGIAAFFAKYDKNANGVIDADEKEAIRKDYAAKPNGDLKKFDNDSDGKLSDEEIAAIKPTTGTKSGGKSGKKAKSADTAEKSDHTGKPAQSQKAERPSTPKPDKEQ